MVTRVESTLHLKNDSQKDSEGWWKWSVWVDGDAGELAAVQAVTYRLHPTFPNSVVRVTDAAKKFRLSASGWGEFAIAADVEMKDGRTLRLERWLDLGGGGDGESKSSDQHRPSVYFSYSVADKEIVSELSDKLQQQGIDVLTAEQIAGAGNSLSSEINEQLDSSDAVIALLSNPPSRWVEQEILSAHRKGTFVVPIILGDAKPSDRLSGLATIQLGDTRYVDGLANQLAARIKDRMIMEEEA